VLFRQQLQLRLQTKVVKTTKNGLMTMEKNHWNSAELFALLTAFRTLIVLMVVIKTVDVVQMMPPSATMQRSAATTSTAQVFNMQPPLLLLVQ
jgi:hypothetical protein